MSLYNSKTYIKDIETAVNSTVDIEQLRGSSILVAGAAGLIGSYIVDILLFYNKIQNADIKIYAVDRKMESLAARFDEVKTSELTYIEHDVNLQPNFDFESEYIIHAASNAFPAVFNTDPVGTIMSNIWGTKLLLDYAMSHRCKKFLYISSGEIYGQGDINLEMYEESYSGYIDPTQPRSCYPNSKRAAETLCVSYTKQFGVDTVIVRPCHTYGPNATSADNRANVQFVNSALRGEDIILKSAGNQMRSYCYIADSSSAILTALINGKSGEAYNIANPYSRVTIADFAKIVAEQTGRKVVFSDPDEVAIDERTPIAKQVLDSSKLEALAWCARFDIQLGIKHTLDIIKECY